MAFSPNALRVHTNEGFTAASGDGKLSFREAHYVTADAAATVEAADYFNAAAGRLPVGTWIEAVMGFPSAVVAKIYVVTANNGSAVTIARLTTAAG